MYGSVRKGAIPLRDPDTYKISACGNTLTLAAFFSKDYEISNWQHILENVLNRKSHPNLFKL